MEYLRIYHFAGMKSSKINELFYKHVSKWPRYLLTMVYIYLFPLKISKEEEKQKN
jgi:hypothetical protein